MLKQFVQFGLVGILGLGAELAVFYTLRRGAGILAAGLAGYAASATLTWWLNRSVFFGLVTQLAVCARYPFLAAGAGSLVGLVCNFSLSRAVVFVGGEKRKKGLLF